MITCFEIFSQTTVFLVMSASLPKWREKRLFYFYHLSAVVLWLSPPQRFKLSFKSAVRSVRIQAQSRLDRSETLCIVPLHRREILWYIPQFELRTWSPIIPFALSAWGSIHTKPGEFGNGSFPLKTYQMLFDYTPPGSFVFIMFSVHGKRKAGVFKFIRFEERFRKSFSGTD